MKTWIFMLLGEKMVLKLMASHSALFSCCLLIWVDRWTEGQPLIGKPVSLLNLAFSWMLLPSLITQLIKASVRPKFSFITCWIFIYVSSVSRNLFTFISKIILLFLFSNVDIFQNTFLLLCSFWNLQTYYISQ